MSASSPARLRIGDWRLDAAAGRMSRGEEVVRLEARTLRLLLDLAENAGEVVSIDALLDRVWAGVIVTPDSVYQAVAALRRLLGDDPRRPEYIATVPRLGYRLVARVEPWTEPEVSTGQGSRPLGVGQTLVIAGLVAVFAGIGALVVREPARAQRPAAAPSVGILPFLDMTPTSNQDILADDVTEGMADRMAAQRGVRATGFRAALQLRRRRLTPVQAARELGVAYVLDGTVRLEGDHVRIGARLIRGDTGFVVWSREYLPTLAQTPAVEAAIAAAVAREAAKPAA
ncbi:MAG: winged helix-turn-helix domain-containing protein [Phenylobacterium sp.]